MTTIGPSVHISGDITSQEDVLVEGQVDGHILVRDAGLTIGERAEVGADVRAVRVLVRGVVKGSIAASDRIELTATATVTGSLSANRIVITDGAHFNGRVDMDQRTIAARVAQFRATQAS